MLNLNRRPHSRSRSRAWVLVAAAVLSAPIGCAGRHSDGGQHCDAVYQVSTIDALLAGDYAPHVPVRQLLHHGDIGIGTFEHVDGEMVVLDGRCYQVRSDGSVRRAPRDAATPFAAVKRFSADLTFDIHEPTTLSALRQRLDAELPSGNYIYAMRIDGRFTSVACRSVPRQTEPDVPLVDVVKAQGQWVLPDVTGTLVGFRCPQWVAGMNVPGEHWHFLTDDRTAGGHVMDFLIERGTVQIDIAHAWHVVFPESGKFPDLDLTRDRREDLHRVEQMPGQK